MYELENDNKNNSKLYQHLRKQNSRKKQNGKHDKKGMGKLSKTSWTDDGATELTYKLLLLKIWR